MDSNTQQTVEINLKDLFFVILRKIWLVALAGVILAGAVFAYKYIPSKADANVLDISEKLDGETDSQYSERVLNVNRANDVINNINTINEQLEGQRKYVAESILMQIDSTNEAVTTAQFTITVSDELTNGIDNALGNSYAQMLKSGEYLEALAEETGIQQGYLKELIWAGYTAAPSAVINADSGSGSVGTLNITVIGQTTELTDRIMDYILDEISSQNSILNETIVSHTIELVGRQSYYMVDTATRDLQYNAITRFDTLQKQITTYDTSLDDVASSLGVSKSSLYAYLSFNDDSWTKNTMAMSSALKYAAIGFVAGAFIFVLAYVVKYLFSNKFSTQAKLFALFPQLERIGVVKPTNKRSKFISWIDVKSGDDDGLSDDRSKAILAANIHNLTRKMNKVVVTGTADSNKIKELFDSMGLKMVVKPSFFSDPTCLDSITEYDGIILVEQRNYSDCRLIAEELKLVANTGVKLIGTVVV